MTDLKNKKKRTLKAKKEHHFKKEGIIKCLERVRSGVNTKKRRQILANRV